MNTEVATFSDLASVQLSLYPALYGLIITFLVGCVIGFLFYKFMKNDRYISNTNQTQILKKGPPKTQQKEYTKKFY